jgi:hypothetical protein
MPSVKGYDHPKLKKTRYCFWQFRGEEKRPKFRFGCELFVSADNLFKSLENKKKQKPPKKPKKRKIWQGLASWWCWTAK